MDEFELKHQRILTLLESAHLEALVLQNVSSFAWATCGAASHVNTATGQGVATLLLTPHGRHLITNNIEATRLREEEKLESMGWEFHIAPWHDAQEAVVALTRGLKVGADCDLAGTANLSDEIARLRARLTPEEGERFRRLGRLCAEAMDHAIRRIQPGQSEHEMAAMLAEQAERRGVQAIVNLVASDERIAAFRHPLPTAKALERYAMLVLCGRRWGLVGSITRLIHFGRLPDDLRRRMEACARVDGAMIQATRPGRTLGDVFLRAQQAYAENGFADEWRLHHQGGPAGYEPRELLATPGSKEPVLLGQAFAWNPSITGAKSEDTILVGASENEVLTAVEGWPMILTGVGDPAAEERPAVLEVR
jgi:antitoxin VapB